MTRKLLLIVCVACLSLTVQAQSSETPSQKYKVSTGTFWQSWFVQADLSLSSFYGDKGNAPAGTVGSGLLEGFRTGMGISLSVGKWFTPGLGLRTRLNGFSGRTVQSEDKSLNSSKYWLLSEQLLFNLSNMFAGYSDTRVWNLIPYAGANLGRNTTHGTYAMGLGLGLLNQWRINQQVSVCIDFSWNIMEPDFDGAGGYLRGHGLHTKDQIASFEVGLSYKLGKVTFNPIPDTNTLNVLYQSQLDALNAQLADEQAESARLRAIIASGKQESKE